MIGPHKPVSLARQINDDRRLPPTAYLLVPRYCIFISSAITTAALQSADSASGGLPSYTLSSNVRIFQSPHCHGDESEEERKPCQR